MKRLALEMKRLAAEENDKSHDHQMKLLEMKGKQQKDKTEANQEGDVKKNEAWFEKRQKKVLRLNSTQQNSGINRNLFKGGIRN